MLYNLYFACRHTIISELIDVTPANAFFSSLSSILSRIFDQVWGKKAEACCATVCAQWKTAPTAQPHHLLTIFSTPAHHDWPIPPGTEGELNQPVLLSLYVACDFSCWHACKAIFTMFVSVYAVFCMHDWFKQWIFKDRTAPTWAV